MQAFGQGLAGAPDGGGRDRPRPAHRAEPGHICMAARSSCGPSCARARKPLSACRKAESCEPCRRCSRWARSAIAGRPIRALAPTSEAGHDGTNAAAVAGNPQSLAEVHCHEPGCFLHSAGHAEAYLRIPAVMKRPIKSPCINVCAIDASTALCAGCGRSIDEIARLGVDDGRRARTYHARAAKRGEFAHNWQRRGD